MTYSKILNDEGFDKEFYKRVADGCTGRDVFWQLNSEYEELTGKQRYSSYDSYRVCKHHRKRQGKH